MRTRSPSPLVVGLSCLMLLTIAARAQEPSKPTATASETDPAVPAAGHSVHGEAFNEGPRQRAVLLSGMGEVDFPVSTSKPQAQAFIDQGVAQLHTFYYLEAERSFRQAALLDPDCVMAYWGMAMANTNNAKRAEGFLKEAEARAKKVRLTPREKLYLDALAAKYKAGGNDKGRRQGWLLGLEAIVQQFPDDLNARVWLAMVTWENSGKGDGIGSRQAVEELIRSVQRVAPNHPGMHHYRIHLWDNVKPEMALQSAALYGPAAPGIAHAWHMPGHTYTGLKRYADAAYQQEASARVDHAAMIRDRIMPFEIHNYAHNNQWFATSASHVGRVRDGIAVARDLVEQPRDPQKNGKNDGGAPQRSGRARWSELLVRYELWDALIEATESGALDWSDIPLERKERLHTLGIAHAGKGDKAGLALQIDGLKALGKEGFEKEEEPSFVGPPTPERVRRDKKPVPGLDAATAELEGYALLLDGKPEDALSRFEKAKSMRPEALARAQLAAGNAEKAVETARKAVRDHVNELPPLACLVEMLHAKGLEDEAKAEYRKLLTLARGADQDLPVLRRIEHIASAWSSEGWAPPTAPAESETDDAAAHRIDLTRLGPLTWSPYQAEPFTLPDTSGTPRTLEEYRGKNVVVIFYLGGACAHCMQQLQAFSQEVEALRGLDTEVVAIGTDDLETTRRLKQNEDKIAFPMPLLADPGMAAFRAYRCFDDFEVAPLHGTFLIDRQGRVRFQRIAYEPFLDVAFIKSEAERINKLQALGR